MLRFLIEAWNDLATERPIGMATGYIPWSMIREWGRYNGLDKEGTQFLIRVIRMVDAERMEQRAAKERMDKARGPS